MSGPKVVRVRSREELADQCYAMIDLLRVSVQECEAFSRHHETLDEASVRRRAGVVAELIAQTGAGAFDAVRKRCASEQEHVQFERAELERKIVGREAADAKRKRREEAIGQIKGQLGLKAEDLGRGTETTESQRKLADALGAEVDGVEILAQRDDRLEQLLAEIRVLDASSEGKALLETAGQLSSERDPTRYKMRMDSVGLEWAKRKQEIAARAARIARARKASLGLARISDEAAQGMRRRVEIALVAPDVSEEVVAEADAFLVRHAQDAAATHRRRAVLQGLATLGYEVKQDLMTATPLDGRIVVKKPASSGYGIEVMMPKGAPRFQVKVVSFKGATEARSPARDRDAETSWCSEFSKLQAMLKKNGTDLTIEQAKGIGAVPVAEVAMSDTEDRQEGVRMEQTRTL